MSHLAEEFTRAVRKASTTVNPRLRACRNVRKNSNSRRIDVGSSLIHRFGESTTLYDKMRQIPTQYGFSGVVLRKERTHTPKSE